MEMCYYGCGRESKYKTRDGRLICEKKGNSCPEVRRLNSERIIELYNKGLKNCNHFDGKRGWRKDRRFAEFGNPGKGDFRSSLLHTRGKKCEICGLLEWMDKPIVLELDHVDGDRDNNTEENLRLLCPNCHSQTPTWRRKKTGKHLSKYSDDEILYAVDNSYNMNQCLNLLGLSWGSGDTILKIMMKHNKTFLVEEIRHKVNTVKIKEELVKKERPRKFEVTKEELHILVWQMSTTKVAERFGVSDKAIDRRCKLLGVSKPPRGYWAKVYAGKEVIG